MRSQKINRDNDLKIIDISRNDTIKKKKHYLFYNPNRRRKIVTKQIYIDLLRLSFAFLVVFVTCVSGLCLYYMERCHTLECAIDTFYNNDTVSDIKDLNELDTKMKLIKDNYNLAVTNYDSIVESNLEMNKRINNVVSDILVLDYENVKLINANDKYYTELMYYKNREELYDKYKYALYYEGERTDITFDQLKTGIDIMEKNGIDPNILFSVIMVESKGKANAKNDSSTASGFGQILTSTGKDVYEDYMGKGSGSFDNSILMDGTKNIEITANYINQLVENNGTITEALYRYRGKDSNLYLNAVDEYMHEGGSSIEEAEKDYKNNVINIKVNK